MGILIFFVYRWLRDFVGLFRCRRILARFATLIALWRDRETSLVADFWRFPMLPHPTLPLVKEKGPPLHAVRFTLIAPDLKKPDGFLTYPAFSGYFHGVGEAVDFLDGAIDVGGYSDAGEAFLADGGDVDSVFG